MSSLEIGYLLLRLPPPSGYRGVDRDPFHPIILSGEVSLDQSLDGTDEIWAMYPVGWRRSAYKVYSESVWNPEIGDIQLVRDLGAALEIQSLIPSEEGHYEILACTVSLVDDRKRSPALAGRSLGYDVAYPGGDYYSAILNGVLLNPDEELLRCYRGELNGNQLFSRFEMCAKYLAAYRRRVESESSSEFAVFELGVPRF